MSRAGAFRFFKLTGALRRCADIYGTEFLVRQSARTRRLGQYKLMLACSGNTLRIEAIKTDTAPLGYRQPNRWKGYYEPNRRTKEGRRAAKELEALGEPGPVDLFDRMGAQPVDVKTSSGVCREIPLLVGDALRGWAVRIPTTTHYLYVPPPELVEITEQEFETLRRPAESKLRSTSSK